MEKQIEEKKCRDCIHYQMCVDTFRKAKQDGEILLIEEEAYFAEAGDCDFYADKRIYRKQREGEWIDLEYYIHDMRVYECSECQNAEAICDLTSTKFCPKCGAHMKGGAE